MATAKQRQRQRAADRVAKAQAILASEVAKIQSGDDWQAYLEIQSLMHAYSPRNVLLIQFQHWLASKTGLVPTPAPSMVAGYRMWESLGRHVDKGQSGYVILAPSTYKCRLAVDSAGTVRKLGKDEHAGPGETEESETGLAGFTTATVFDVSQTSGDPLPDPPLPKLLAGEAPVGLGQAVMALIEEHGYTVETVPEAVMINGANGQTDWGSKSVVVRADMDDAAMVKTLIHEAAHVLLHVPPATDSLSRSQKEVEAESVAFVVAYAHGMVTDGYSFPYVARWAADGGVDAVLAAQQRVSRAAKTILAVTPAEHLDGGRMVRAPARTVETPELAPALSMGVSL